jgi:hypothetical protein
MYIPLEKDEQIVMQVHRHWFFLLTHAVLLALVLALPYVLWVLFVRAGILASGGIDAGAAWILIVLWVLVGWTLYFKFFTLYWLDIWVVTNKRLIDVDYKRLFDRDIAILRIEQVQDVQVRVTGVLGNLLKYGSVNVQTAGTSREFVIDQIAMPEAVRDAIVRYSNASSASNV